MRDEESFGCPICGKPRDREESMQMLRTHAARGNFRFKTYDMCPGCENRVEEAVEELMDTIETDEEAAKRVSKAGKRLVDIFLDD